MKTWKAVALGAAAALSAPAILPVALALVRPLVKAMTTQALVSYEIVRVHLAVATEELEDLFAEARAEAKQTIDERRRPAAAPAARPVNGPAGDGATAPKGPS